MNKCPHCGGTNGYAYKFVERVNMSGLWGNASSESAEDFDILSTNKYVKCFDCGKRVNLEVARAVRCYMAKPTKTQIKEYLEWLDDDFDLVKKLYKQAEDAILTINDTSSDEFQIVADILDVFSRKTEAHLTMFAPDPPSALPSAGKSDESAGG